ncbi:MAG: magnesium transporter [Ktedonobacteraceae bacterium]|nr:magnesium transporter [Ktedonobacteraceae bacterium]
MAALFIFSQLVGQPIKDPRGEKVAVLKDVIVHIDPREGKSDEMYPALAGLLVHTAGRDVWIPAAQVATFEEKSIRLASAQMDLQRFIRRDGEILLGKDVLDKQLVDIEGRRVVRVNDLALGQVPGELELRLLAVDISLRALSRRVLFSLSGEHPRGKEKLLDWADVQYFASNAPAVQLHVSHERLGKLHPADLARILDDLSHQQRDELMRTLDDETVADTLEEMDSDEAADILEEIEEERASDILEEMNPDAAADIVADLDQEKADKLLSLMDYEESEDVRELLFYSRDSAGGMMTNDFLFLPAHLEAAEALRQIRAMEEQPEFVDYLYVAEPGTERVIGVASLRDVVFCPDRTTPLDQIMEHDLVSVQPTTPSKEAATLLTAYGLRAIPVLDDEGIMLGIITFDDALDVLLPDDLRERVGHIFIYHRNRRDRSETTT